MHMLEIFDMSEAMLKQQKLAVQQRIDMFESIMMQSQMPMDVSMAPGASLIVNHPSS